MLRIILAGAAGRMGRAVLALAGETEGVSIAARIDPALGTSLDTCKADADVLIDFSTPEALHGVLAFCASRGMGLVLATTGHPEAAKARIGEAAERIAILRSANLSYGAYVLAKLAAQAAGLLREKADVTIVETHHRAKKDAPSGTAKLLADAMEIPGAAIVSLRGGSVTGVHEIHFFGESDIVTLRHEAIDRRLFAQGALDAAKWVASCAPGLYGMEDFMDLPSHPASYPASRR